MKVEARPPAPQTAPTKRPPSARETVQAPPPPAAPAAKGPEHLGKRVDVNA